MRCATRPLRQSSMMLAIVLCLTWTLGAEDVSVENELVPLKIELPPPLFSGTPSDIRDTNLAPDAGRSRPPFLAPKGLVNVALGKGVSASDEFPVVGELELITDGDKNADEGYFVEFGPGTQYIQIDLQQNFTTHAIVLWHFHSQKRVYRDVIVQTASDVAFTTEVVTLFNNDFDNSSGLGIGEDLEYIETYQGKLINLRGRTLRYLRLYSHGNTANDMNHYIEVEVYGVPVSE